MTDENQPAEMLRRPECQLDRLPIRFRWEVTRQHPVYLQLWQVVQSAWTTGGKELVDEIRRQPVFLNAASAIRVFGELIDPAMSFDESPDASTDGLFRRDSLQPVDVNSIAGVLLRMMSNDGLRGLANMMTRFANARDESEPEDQVGVGNG